MTSTRDMAVETFVDAGHFAARLGILPEALDHLIARLDQAGLLDPPADGICFTRHHEGVCPRCGHKQDPGRPHPKPPPEPKPPPKGPKGCDCAHCITHRRYG